MAMGKPIVASALDQIAEVLHHDETAWLVDPGDEAALRDGLQRLVVDVELAERLGKSARAAAEARHSWRAHTDRILAALERLAPPP
jgi:glycosyltransferase involved in cell wall biosynthesis